MEYSLFIAHLNVKISLIILLYKTCHVYPPNIVSNPYMLVYIIHIYCVYEYQDN